MLADDIQKKINDEYKRSDVSLKVNQVILFRPVLHELPFENLEVINDAKRCLACNPIHMRLLMNHRESETKDYDFEIELKFVSNNGFYVCEYSQMMACDIWPNEDPNTVQANLSQYAKVTGLLMLSRIKEMV